MTPACRPNGVGVRSYESSSISLASTNKFSPFKSAFDLSQIFVNFWLRGTSAPTRGEEHQWDSTDEAAAVRGSPIEWAAYLHRLIAFA